MGSDRIDKATLLTTTDFELLVSLNVFNEALSVSLGNRTIKPGKQTKLKIMLHPDRLQRAKSRPRVLLITNDPSHAKAVIHVAPSPVPAQGKE